MKSLQTSLTRLPKRKAEFIEPMDCAPVSKLPDGSQWLFEIKLDGYRAIAVKADGRVNLFSRRRKSFDHHYPIIVEALAELPEGSVVDGEIVALDGRFREMLPDWFVGNKRSCGRPNCHCADGKSVHTLDESA